MLESKQGFAITDEKTIERIVDDENVNINHMVLNNGEGLPEHYSNSNVYMIVIRGTISLRLDDQDTHIYSKGSIINIPYNVKMNVFNDHKETLEFFVVKAPCPKNYNKYIKIL
ncbi:cupin domain-containing protein [Lutispora saccharofermentans]|uniref:Cupin domain-containing protein n=1 Tax=Lutispora saccharofermentans TaxID=3024236 RepID=A0ABT1NGH6_9FIRM|nr:cupin domain-containing protein [Lutispora saccharofermentans]MCQ1530338.1 cupin domain-containing protein [Lutispora saccharofermentans]